MSRVALGGFIAALALVAAVIFVGVTIHEINSKRSPPFGTGRSQR